MLCKIFKFRNVARAGHGAEHILYTNHKTIALSTIVELM